MTYKEFRTLWPFGAGLVLIVAMAGCHKQFLAQSSCRDCCACSECCGEEVGYDEQPCCSSCQEEDCCPSCGRCREKRIGKPNRARCGRCRPARRFKQDRSGCGCHSPGYDASVPAPGHFHPVPTSDPFSLPAPPAVPEDEQPKPRPKSNLPEPPVPEVQNEPLSVIVPTDYRAPVSVLKTSIEVAESPGPSLRFTRQTSEGWRPARPRW